MKRSSVHLAARARASIRSSATMSPGVRQRGLATACCLKRSLLDFIPTSNESPWACIFSGLNLQWSSFAFATINPSTFEVEATDSDAEELMQRIGTVKILQPDLKMWIDIGGWTFSDSDQATAKTFSILSASKPRQKTFARSLVSMMNTFGFDGVDIDWVSTSSWTY